jgi:hypothetical protein
MMWRSGRVLLVGLVASLTLAGACSRTNPAFQGAADAGPTPQRDAAVADGAVQGDGSSTGDAACQGGAPCTAAGNRCQVGTTSCAGGGATCESLTPALDGTPCGLDQVCKDGSCIDCAAGTRCDPGVECKAGRLDCSFTSGDVVCAESGAAPDGTTCPSGVCYQGACNSATCSTGGTVCDQGMICDRNGCAADVVGVCVAKPSICTDEVDYVCGCNGTTYVNGCLRQQAGEPLAHPGVCFNAQENCQNGIDDNGDGLTDCDDPQCQQAGFTCVEPPPTGWTDVGWLDDDDPYTLLTCPSILASKDLYLTSALSAPSLGCTCECGTASAACALTLSCWSNDPTVQCANTATFTVNEYAGGCHSVALTAGNWGCKAGEPHILGACPATTKTNRPAVTWNPSARACLAGSAGVCPADGTACVPPQPAGTIGPCIVHAGDVQCPTTGSYTERHPYYTGQPVDGRSCSTCASCTPTGACTCDSSGGACGVQLHTDNACTSASPQEVAATSQCLPVSAATGTTYYADTKGLLAPTGVGCTPSTSYATGSIANGPAITLCCIPGG